MNQEEMMLEIKDANLNYLMLAQQLIRADKATAIFRLGISKDIADLLEGLSNLQLLKLCNTNMMLARFRFLMTATSLVYVDQLHQRSCTSTLTYSRVNGRPNCRSNGIVSIA